MVEDSEKSKDYVYLSNCYLNSGKIKEAKQALNNANKYLIYIKDNAKKIQQIYNNLQKLKIYQNSNISIKSAKNCFKEIKILSDEIRADSGSLYPEGLAGYYLAKIYSYKNQFKKAIQIISQSYEYLESFNSFNINVIAACLRLFNISLLIKQEADNQKKIIAEQLKIAKISFYKIPTIKKYYVSEIKKLEILLKKPEAKKSNVYKLIDKIISIEPYI